MHLPIIFSMLSASGGQNFLRDALDYLNLATLESF